MCHQHGLATASLLDQNKVHSLLTNAADLGNQNLAVCFVLQTVREDDSRERPVSGVITNNAASPGRRPETLEESAPGHLSH